MRRLKRPFVVLLPIVALGGGLVAIVGQSLVMFRSDETLLIAAGVSDSKAALGAARPANKSH